jgi:hypothetical protein
MEHIQEQARESSEAAPQDDPLLCRVELPLREVFYPLGFAVEIITNSQSVLDAAGESWAGLNERRFRPALQLRIWIADGETEACPPSPAVRAHRNLLTIVADAEHQAICDLEAGSSFAWLSGAALRHRRYLRYHFIEAIALVLISTSYATAIHAACVSLHGRGILLCGDSGAGKSSLAYACARAGWTYTSDDACYLLRGSDKPLVIGNSHQLRFRPSASELFPELTGRDQTPRAEGKPSVEVPTRELPRLLTSDEAAVHAIVFLKRRSSPAAELVPLPKTVAIHRFHRAIAPYEEMQHLQAEAMRSLASAGVYELRYRDLPDAIELLGALVSDEWALPMTPDSAT